MRLAESQYPVTGAVMRAQPIGAGAFRAKRQRRITAQGPPPMEECGVRVTRRTACSSCSTRAARTVGLVQDEQHGQGRIARRVVQILDNLAIRGNGMFDDEACDTVPMSVSAQRRDPI
jgi:hypothetical protein